MLKLKKDTLLRAKKMELLDFEVAALVAIIILVSIAGVYSSLIGQFTIHSSGMIALETGPLAFPFSYASELRYTYFGSEAMLIGDWNLVASTINEYDMGPVIQKALYSYYAPFPLGPINNDNFGVDKLREALDALHPLGIKYHISMAIMYGLKDPSHAQITASGGTSAVWADPSNPFFRAHIKAVVEALVQKYEIDGFSFDYVRYEALDVPYGPYAKAEFEAYLGESISDADFITGGAFAPNGARYEEFMQWRPMPINNLVGDMRKWMDDARALYHPTLPPLEYTATTFADTVSNLWWIGQDAIFWVKEGYIDVLLPMYYTQSLANTELYFSQSQKLLGGIEGVIPLSPLLTHSHGGIKTPSNWALEVESIKASGADGWSSWAYGGPGHISGENPVDMRDYWALIERPPTFSLSNITVSSTANSATITWATNLPATSKVEYSTSPLFNASKIAAPSPDYPFAQLDYWDIDHVPGTVVDDATPKTNHSITLSDLSPGTMYYFRVQSEDANGIATSKVSTFQL